MRRHERYRSSLLLLGSIAVALALVQNLVLRDVSVFGVHPDALLLLVVCSGIALGSDRGAVIGFGAGLLADVFLPSALGLSAVVYTVAGYAAGALADDAAELPWIVSLLAMITTAGAVVVLGLTGWLTGDVDAGLGRVLWVAAVDAVINALCAPWLTALMRRISVAPGRLYS